MSGFQSLQVGRETRHFIIQRGILPGEERSKNERDQFAKEAAMEIGAPGFVFLFIYFTFKRVESVGDFFSWLTVVQAVVLLAGTFGSGYLIGLLVWRFKRMIENSHDQ